MIRIYPIEIPGRGTRFAQPLWEDIEVIVDDIFEIIKRDINNSLYAFFGHSMGTILIYELTRRIKNAGYSEPLHIFLSGRFPPHINEKKLISDLPDDQFKKEIFELGGTPKELIESQELFDVFLPILRSDYKAIENYKMKHERIKWTSNISVLYGSHDKEIVEHEYNEWANYTEGTCEFYKYCGDHFFIHKNTDKILDLLNNTLVKEYNRLMGGFN